MTQYLLEEAALLAVDYLDAKVEEKAREEASEAHEAAARAERLRALAKKAVGR